MDLPAGALPVITRWLPQQRWFAGKGRPIGAARLVASTALTERAWHVFVTVVVDGQEQLYQVPVLLSDQPADGLIGELPVGFLLDGALHTTVMRALLGQAHWLHRPPASAVYRPLSVEQSHSAGVLGEEVFIKLYRRLTPGRNPDVEVQVALTRAGCREIPRVWGWVDADVPGGPPMSAALLQEYLPDAVTGWDLAQTGGLAPFARDLGESTARLHTDLAGAFPTADVTAEEIAQRILGRVRAVAREIPDVAQVLPDVVRRVAALAGSGPVSVQRIHGDFHLGQVLRTGHAWRVIDFEGEPGRPTVERAALDSPWRDVAGMLRSLDYARCDVADAFLAGYGHMPDPDLLSAYLIDKVVYEVAYESRNRPDWVHIPLRALYELL